MNPGRWTTKALRAAVLAADELLDLLPCREDGRWRWYGEWGCRLQLVRFWYVPDGGVTPAMHGSGDMTPGLPGAASPRGAQPPPPGARNAH